MSRGNTYIPSMASRLQTALFVACALFPLTFQGPVRAGETPVVVELYTSQGCSSCPPADETLAGIAGRDDVIALAMHVDYWDYLGWRDTFAQRAFTERQAGYRDAWQKNVLYTPQVIVHGRQSVNGLQPAQLDRAIEEARAAETPARLTLQREGDMVKCLIEPQAGAVSGAGPAQASGTIWIAKYTRQATVSIDRGENAGRTITYVNVVSSLDRIGTWSGEEIEDVAMPQPGPGEGVAIWLQQGDSGPILAAAKLENPE